MKLSWRILLLLVVFFFVGMWRPSCSDTICEENIFLCWVVCHHEAPLAIFVWVYLGLCLGLWSAGRSFHSITLPRSLWLYSKPSNWQRELSIFQVAGATWMPWPFACLSKYILETTCPYLKSVSGILIRITLNLLTNLGSTDIIAMSTLLICGHSLSFYLFRSWLFCVSILQRFTSYVSFIFLELL